jgi:hypothetical protein
MKRSRSIHIRVSDAELSGWKQMAFAYGYCLSEYVRVLLQSELRTMKRVELEKKYWGSQSVDIDGKVKNPGSTDWLAGE